MKALVWRTERQQWLVGQANTRLPCHTYDGWDSEQRCN